MLWTENTAGVQHVTFWVNGELVGGTQLPKPFGPLSLELWNDNQVPTATGLEFRNATAEQRMDVDFVGVGRP
jgi:hypothetical protein